MDLKLVASGAADKKGRKSAALPWIIDPATMLMLSVSLFTVLSSVAIRQTECGGAVAAAAVGLQFQAAAPTFADSPPMGAQNYRPRPSAARRRGGIRAPSSGRTQMRWMPKARQPVEATASSASEREYLQLFPEFPANLAQENPIHGRKNSNPKQQQLGEPIDLNKHASEQKAVPDLRLALSL